MVLLLGLWLGVGVGVLLGLVRSLAWRGRSRGYFHGGCPYMYAA